MVLIVALLGLACYAAALAGVRRLRASPAPAPLALPVDVGEDDEGVLERLYGSFGERHARRVVAWMPAPVTRYVQHRIDAAGRPEGLTLSRYTARVVVWTLLGAAAGVLLLPVGGAVLGVLATVLGAIATDLWLTRLVNARQLEIDRDMPDFLDIMASTVGAGLQFRTALARVAQARPGALSDEMQVTLRQMALGMSRRDAFEQLRARNDSDALSTFVTALLQSEELGAPLSDTLLQLSSEMRRDFRHQALRRAAKAVPKLTLVVVFLVVPGALTLLVAAFLVGQPATLIELPGFGP